MPGRGERGVGEVAGSQVARRLGVVGDALTLRRAGRPAAALPCHRRHARYWPFCEVPACPVEVRIEGYNGLDLLTLSSSHFGPSRTLSLIQHLGPRTISQ